MVVVGRVAGGTETEGWVVVVVEEEKMVEGEGAGQRAEVVGEQRVAALGRAWERGWVEKNRGRGRKWLWGAWGVGREARSHNSRPVALD